MLTFEWILLVALLVVGLIGGLAGLRNALLDQLQDLENAVEAMNFSGTSTTTASTSATAQRALAKGSGVALVSDSGNSAKRIASGVQSQSEPGTLSLDSALARSSAVGHDSTPSREISTDANAWWNSGYR